MTIIQLEYLLAVANCGSFSLAAEHCFVTQPSLSMQVKALEEELGVVLLDRSKKPVIPRARHCGPTTVFARPSPS